ncbi:hypothetical protein BX666DRAFT_1382807 [Dichotomocladium elegans]|nr:hypothetical protein BX666DRAFT_1382807 [Dichotomocladium elegans]
MCSTLLGIDVCQFMFTNIRHRRVRESDMSLCRKSTVHVTVQIKNRRRKRRAGLNNWTISISHTQPSSSHPPFRPLLKKENHSFSLLFGHVSHSHHTLQQKRGRMDTMTHRGIHKTCSEMCLEESVDVQSGTVLETHPLVAPSDGKVKHGRAPLVANFGYHYEAVVKTLFATVDLAESLIKGLVECRRHQSVLFTADHQDLCVPETVLKACNFAIHHVAKAFREIEILFFWQV